MCLRFRPLSDWRMKEWDDMAWSSWLSSRISRTHLIRFVPILDLKPSHFELCSSDFVTHIIYAPLWAPDWRDDLLTVSPCREENRGVPVFWQPFRLRFGDSCSSSSSPFLCLGSCFSPWSAPSCQINDAIPDLCCNDSAKVRSWQRNIGMRGGL